MGEGRAQDIELPDLSTPEARQRAAERVHAWLGGLLRDAEAGRTILVLVEPPLGFVPVDATALGTLIDVQIGDDSEPGAAGRIEAQLAAGNREALAKAREQYEALGRMFELPSRPGHDGPAAGRTLEADRKQARPGEVVQVYVRLRNPGGVANMNYELRYDPAVARPEGEAVAGNLLRGRALFQANPGERGRIRIGFAGSDGLERDGTVTVIPFRAVGQPGTRTALTLAIPVTEGAQGQALSIARVDGAIEILRGAGGGADGRGGDAAGGGGTGGGGGDGGRLPDCNGDGRITSLDADCALGMSVRARPVDLGLDADDDGQVTSGDARILLQRVRDGAYRP